MNARTLLDAGMTAVYTAAGALLLFSNALHEAIPRYRSALGAVLIGYGVLRAYLLWRKRKAAAPMPDRTTP